jgi:hypothetical protein
MSIRLVASLALSAALAAGCAAAPPPAVAPQAPPPEPIDDPSAIGYTSEVGGLPEEAMQDAFASLGKDVEHCIASGYSRLESLGGHVELGLKIDTSGRATAVFVRQSALGDRETEKCIVDAAKSRTWPHAVGGEGLAETSYDATPAKDPAVWDSKKVRAVIEQVRASTARCRRGIGGAFVVTAYVRPDGRVESAGLAMSTPEGDQAADCIVEQVRKARFGFPGRSSKLSFDL